MADALLLIEPARRIRRNCRILAILSEPSLESALECDPLEAKPSYLRTEIDHFELHHSTLRGRSLSSFRAFARLENRVNSACIGDDRWENPAGSRFA